MIVKEHYQTRADGVNLDRTYSDKGLKIKKSVTMPNGRTYPTNQIYIEAIDVEGAPYTYEETDTPIEEGQHDT